jgi:hypothetical protein
MSVNAPKPLDMLPIDYADHTLEVDIRWLLSERPELSEHAGNEDTEDPRTAANLTAEQVEELLSRGK